MKDNHRQTRYTILNVPVDAVNMESALERVVEMIRSDQGRHFIAAVNFEKIMASRKNDLLKNVLPQASLLIPDGVGAVWGLKILYGVSTERVPGVDLMHNICRLAAQDGYRLFIYGSREEVNRKAVEKLQELYPGLNVVGRSNGYVKEDQQEVLIKGINNSGADILFVGLGSPKQEFWLQNYFPRVEVKVCQGIGGTLDTITGNVKRAPASFQRSGFEWLYRLYREPNRIRRQLIIPHFFMLLFYEKLNRLITDGKK
jgi:N-acetylglucosaminyldiphosphoundecaprenol N-acetyl-beta-D-mannosaminyltransferase